MIMKSTQDPENPASSSEGGSNTPKPEGEEDREPPNSTTNRTGSSKSRVAQGADNSSKGGSNTPKQKGKPSTPILWHIFFAYVVAIVLICGRQMFQDKTEAGQWIDYATYNIIQNSLRSYPTSTEKPRVTVVDLSEIKVSRIPGAQKGEEATPRGPLSDLIDNLVNLGPIAIGVDVDFSPESTYRTPEDPKFFEHLLGLRPRVPIYLGISRRHALEREKWLLNERYKELAVSILVPNKATLKDAAECFQIRGDPKQSGADDKCDRPTISEKLVEELNNRSVTRQGFLDKLLWFVRSWFVEPISTEEIPKSNMNARLFSVDYSDIDDLIERRTIRSTKEDILNRHQDLIRDHVVLVGDVNSRDASDTFQVPGRLNSLLVPGVYIHAAAIHTLYEAQLYRFNKWSRWLVDLVLASAVIIPIALYKHGTRREFAPPRLEGTLIVIVAVVVVFISLACVRRTHLLWDDFLLVIFAFLLHPSVESYGRSIACWLHRVGKFAWTEKGSDR